MTAVEEEEEEEKGGVVNDTLLVGDRFWPISSERMTEIENGFLGLSPSPSLTPPPRFGGVSIKDRLLLNMAFDVRPC